MKCLSLILIALIPAFGNEFICKISPNRDIDAQIETCKLEILQHECEKRGMKVVSSTTTTNYTLTNDKIRTYSLCRDLKFTVTNAELNQVGDQIRVSYVMNGKTLAAEDISYNNWSDLGSVQTKTTANIGATQREDSTMLLNISANVQIDSREVKKQVREIKNKAISTISTLLTD